MVSCAGASSADIGVTFGDGGAPGFGIASTRGAGAVGRSTGVAEDFGAAAFAGFGVFSGSGGFFCFAVAFDLGNFFLAADFFFAAFGFFGVALGDSVDLGETAVGSGVSLGFGFGDGDAGFFPASLCGDAFDFALGLGDSSGVDLDADEGLFCAFGLCFADFGLAVELGDSSGDGDAAVCASSRAFKNSSRLCLSSSLTCARRNVPIIALSATAVASQGRKRTTAAERNREKSAFKPPALQGPVVSTSPHVHVRGEGSRSIFHREEAANKSDTSR